MVDTMRRVPRVHVVRPGDTLWGIAADPHRGYGDGTRWTEVYEANALLIDARAAAHGLEGGGHWIFPGDPLVLPGLSDPPRSRRRGLLARLLGR